MIHLFYDLICMEFIGAPDDPRPGWEGRPPEGSFLTRVLLSGLKGLIGLLLAFMWLLLSASVS